MFKSGNNMINYDNENVINDKAIRGLWSPNSGIIDYRYVCNSLARDIRDSGGKFIVDFKSESFREYSKGDTGLPGIQITSSSGMVCLFIIR
jgi:L-2-hydroxyglutarate oxidase LhgO